MLMVVISKMDEKQLIKLEEIKFDIQIWHHQAELFWNRISSFTTLLTIGTTIIIGAFVIGQNIEAIETIKQDHHRPERNEMKVQFNVIVKELKVVFHEGFDYHEILHPIDVREEPEAPPQVIELLN